ncbi:MAG: hypothetical protein DRP73_03890 [Candidatus Omnitrophota bacterium]|nr:MAG: hypothetical protein DRP73_03890 [Candidatus Omnitrophota bacterium]
MKGRMGKRGIALIVAIAMLLVATILQVAYIALFYNNYRASEILVKKIKSYYYTYGALNRVLAAIYEANGVVTAQEGTQQLTPLTINYYYKIEPQGGEYTDPATGLVVRPFKITVKAPAEDTAEIKAYSQINYWCHYIVEDTTSNPVNKIKTVFFQEVIPGH